MTIRDLVNCTDRRTKLVIIAGGMQLDMDAMIEAVGTDQGAMVVSVADSYKPKHLQMWQYAKPGTHPADVEVR